MNANTNCEFGRKCDVCLDEETNEADILMECAGCKVLVHQYCYGKDLFSPEDRENPNWKCKLLSSFPTIDFCTERLENSEIV